MEFEWPVIAHCLTVEHLIAPSIYTNKIVATAAFGSAGDDQAPQQGDHARSSAYYGECALRFVEQCHAPARLLVCSAQVATSVRARVRDLHAAQAPVSRHGLILVTVDPFELFGYRFDIQDAEKWLEDYCRRFKNPNHLRFAIRALKSPILDLALHLTPHAAHSLWARRLDLSRLTRSGRRPRLGARDRGGAQSPPDGSRS